MIAKMNEKEGRLRVSCCVKSVKLIKGIKLSNFEFAI